MKQYGKLYKSLRRKKGYTRKDVYQYLDMSRQAYGSIERGDNKPSAQTHKLLCMLFDIEHKPFRSIK